MATIIVPGEEKLQAHLPIVHGGNNYDLGVALTYRTRGNEIPLAFRVKDGNKETELLVKLSDLRDAVGTRTMWTFAGTLLNGRFGKQSGCDCDGTPFMVHPKVEGGYDSSVRQGAIKIFAFEQPKPLIEMLEWGEMLDRILTQRLGDVIEMRWDGPNDVYRGIIQGTEFLGDRFQIECDRLYRWRDNAWTATGDKVLRVMIPRKPDAPAPLAFADGRITFELEGDMAGLRHSFTVYPSKKIGW